ncbi:MAG: SigB/SigF/SigG family RNA polymerase sigma factor [Lachnospiraceae bacterium]|nr:SigB/SigF/SigG family RNA polymerase sigma factor [Lachnospiraceae bacterium]
MDDTLLLIQKAHAGDKKAREEAIRKNMGLVYSIARRFYNRGVEQEDLIQIGSIGLMKAIDKFNLDYEVCFSTYAVPMISGEMKRFLRDDGMIKVSRSLKELAARAYACREVLQAKTAGEVTLAQIAVALEVEQEELVMAMDAISDIDSLQKTVYQQDDGQEISLGERLSIEDNGEEQILNRILLQQSLEGLEKRERQFIYLRYFCQKTQQEIGREFGISQVQVSRLEKKILQQMRMKLERRRE